MLSVATILLLAAVVESCVNFKAIEVGNNNGLLQIELWDNSVDPRCSLIGYPSHDQVYDLNCDAPFGATFDRSSTDVTYTTDHGQFDFLAPGDGFAGYKACLYDCVNPGDCFV